MNRAQNVDQLETGTLLRMEPLPPKLWPDGAQDGRLVEYVTLNFDGGKRAVSGSVFLPPNQTGEPAPVLGWAHCTVGLNPHSAPSKAGLLRAEREHLSSWLHAGFAVAASDYEGLGTGEPHPYLDGEAAADDVVDMVRALRDCELDVGDATVFGGFSQGGHAALYIALLCSAYAPELDHRATVTLAPPVRLEHFVEVRTDVGADPVDPLVPIVLAGLRTRRPDYRPESGVTPRGAELLRLAADAATSSLVAACKEHSNDSAGFTGKGREAETLAALRSISPPATKLDRPVLLASGDRDPVLTPAQARDFAASLDRAGTPVELREYEHSDHLELLEPAGEEAVDWASELVRGAAPERVTPTDPRAPLRFRMLDVNGDGVLSADDFRALAMRVSQSMRLPLGDPRSQSVGRAYESLWDRLAEVADVDGDGRVDLGEFSELPDALAPALFGAVESVLSAAPDQAGADSADLLSFIGFSGSEARGVVVEVEGEPSPTLVARSAVDAWLGGAR